MFQANEPNNVFNVNPINDDNMLKLSNKCLFEHQVSALLAIKHHFLENDTATLVFPTGAGKSAVGVMACYHLGAKNVLVITPAKVISDQFHADFCGTWNEQTNKLDFGVAMVIRRGIFRLEDAYKVLPRYTGTKANSSYEIQTLGAAQTLLVANAQKFSGSSNVNLEDLDPKFFDFLIIDEAHHYPSPTWLRIVQHFKNAKILFMTATPNNELKESICFYKGFTSRLHREEAIEKGIIRKTEWIEKKSLKSAIVCVRKMLAEHDTLVKGRSHKAMVLTRTTDEATEVSKNFNENNIRASAYIGGVKKETLDDFQKQDDFRVLVVCGRCLEGFDCSLVSIALILRKVARTTRVMFTQFVGRAVRKVDRNDPVVAVVMSTKNFDQYDNYNQFINPVLAVVDPQDDE